MNTIPCIYCHKEAVLQTSQRTIQKGITKITVPQHSYKCTVCERTFRTREQILEDGDLKKMPVTPMIKGTHIFTTNGNADKDNH